MELTFSFSWVKMERRFSVRTVCSLDCELSQSRSGPAVCVIRKHFMNHLPQEIDHLSFYSDSWSGQNRNIKLTLVLKHFLAKTEIQLIEKKDFISGHSYNSCDQCFGKIEQARRLFEVIPTPDHWIDIIKSSTKQSVFEVTRIVTADFVSSKNLKTLITNRKVDMKKEKINWFSTRCFKYDREQLFSICMIDDEEKVQKLNIRKRKIT